MSEAGDLLMNFLRDNPPQDALELRALLDGFMIQLGNADLPDIGASHDDIVIAQRGGRPLTVDVHVPKGVGPFPVLVYLHGGGWVFGSPKTHRRVGFRFAAAGFLVFNVHYALAPEQPFPAAFDDCVAAIAGLLHMPATTAATLPGWRSVVIRRAATSPRRRSRRWPARSTSARCC
jgi:acetyl esterase/lipase